MSLLVLLHRNTSAMYIENVFKKKMKINVSCRITAPPYHNHQAGTYNDYQKIQFDRITTELETKNLHFNAKLKNINLMMN